MAAVQDCAPVKALLLFALAVGPIFHLRAGGREDLATTTRSGVELDESGAARLGPGLLHGTLKTTELVPERPFTEAIVSWEADAPEGTSIEVQARALVNGHWTRFYIMGVWSESSPRHSVADQADGNGRVDTDTLLLARPATALQLGVTLTATRAGVTPRLRGLHAIVSGGDAPPPRLEPDRRAWGLDLFVPRRSQMLYPKGGEVWCSPTSLAMVLDYWGVSVPVPLAAESIYDGIYDGTGNWPFNTAYAAVRGGARLEAFVTRLYQIEQLERLIAAGIPVVAGVAFGKDELPNAPVPWSDGHLIVVSGFDVRGDVIVNDPAAPWDDLVHLTYARQAFDRAWSRSGRMIYLIHASAQLLPEAGALGCW
jgi:hypothetical protein